MNYTLEQLANVMSVSKDAVKKRAARETWAYEEERCRGGRRRLYLAESLPDSVRRQLPLSAPAPIPEPIQPRAGASLPVPVAGGFVHGDEGDEALSDTLLVGRLVGGRAATEADFARLTFLQATPPDGTNSSPKRGSSFGCTATTTASCIPARTTSHLTD